MWKYIFHVFETLDSKLLNILGLRHRGMSMRGQWGSGLSYMHDSNKHRTRCNIEHMACSLDQKAITLRASKDSRMDPAYT